MYQRRTRSYVFVCTHTHTEYIVWDWSVEFRLQQCEMARYHTAERNMHINKRWNRSRCVVRPVWARHGSICKCSLRFISVDGWLIGITQGSRAFLALFFFLSAFLFCSCCKCCIYLFRSLPFSHYNKATIISVQESSHVSNSYKSTPSWKHNLNMYCWSISSIFIFEFSVRLYGWFSS